MFALPPPSSPGSRTFRPCDLSREIESYFWEENKMSQEKERLCNESS